MRIFQHQADHALSGPTRCHFKTGTLAERMCFIRKRGGTGETQERQRTNVSSKANSNDSRRVMNVQIRHGNLSELELLREIEREAGVVFAQQRMPEIADDDPPSIEELSQYCNAKRLWVAVDDCDHPVAYIIAKILGQYAHIDQVSVHPCHAGRRIGSALIDSVEQWAASLTLSALTLTCFRHVPWNAPYYQSIGFETIPEHALTRGLKEIRREEKQRGLDRWPRCGMKRNIRSIES